eukprot:TRINITY_DN1276_c0_g1_i1.p1 TRINITY_DN1276_c0_g1~~TRINITY_DN1276_c0_g1_i1.p1  ORF type:complete len:533 (+),score=135.14 TRINITY_DN1276_c0_g1_i1:36-1634(+)
MAYNTEGMAAQGMVPSPAPAVQYSGAESFPQVGQSPYFAPQPAVDAAPVPPIAPMQQSWSAENHQQPQVMQPPPQPMLTEPPPAPVPDAPIGLNSNAALQHEALPGFAPQQQQPQIQNYSVPPPPQQQQQQQQPFTMQNGYSERSFQSPQQQQPLYSAPTTTVPPSEPVGQPPQNGHYSQPPIMSPPPSTVAPFSTQYTHPQISLQAYPTQHPVQQQVQLTDLGHAFDSMMKKPSTNVRDVMEAIANYLNSKCDNIAHLYSTSMPNAELRKRTVEARLQKIQVKRDALAKEEEELKKELRVLGKNIDGCDAECQKIEREKNSTHALMKEFEEVFEKYESPVTVARKEAEQKLKKELESTKRELERMKDERERRYQEEDRSKESRRYEEDRPRRKASDPRGTGALLDLMDRSDREHKAPARSPRDYADRDRDRDRDSRSSSRAKDRLPARDSYARKSEDNLSDYSNDSCYWKENDRDKDRDNEKRYSRPSKSSSYDDDRFVDRDRDRNWERDSYHSNGYRTTSAKGRVNKTRK